MNTTTTIEAQPIQEKSLSRQISNTVSKCVAYPHGKHTATDTDVIVLANALAMSMADHVKSGSSDELFAKSAKYYVEKIEALYTESKQAIDELGETIKGMEAQT